MRNMARQAGVRPWSTALLLTLIGVGLLLLPNWPVDAGPQVLNAPVDITCSGREETTVRVKWVDTSSDETEHRVERKIGNGAFAQVAQLTGTSWDDVNADVSSQNRQYRVRSFRQSDNSFSGYSPVCNNRRIFETDKYRIFYGLLGTSDLCPTVESKEVCLTNTNDGSGDNKFVKIAATTLQGSLDAFARVGFAQDASIADGFDKFPINIVWCDGGGCSGFGYGLGLSPALMEKPFDTVTREGDPAAYIVVLHEVFHALQGKYGGLVDPSDTWVKEGQARAIQDKFCLGANTNTCLAFDDITGGSAGYVPEIQDYLGNTNQSINKASYEAVLFWSYLVDRYGKQFQSNPVESGMDFMVKFWEDSAANPGRDGISVINSTLTTMGYSQQFNDVWKDFAVATFARVLTGPNVPISYTFKDTTQLGGSYGSVKFAVSKTLALGGQQVKTDNTVKPYAANYYNLRLEPGVPSLVVSITQETNVPLFYDLLLIRNGSIVTEVRQESAHFYQTVPNDNIDQFVLVIAGLENQANYRYAFNGVQPTVRLLSPTKSRQGLAGDPANPDKILVTTEVVDSGGLPLPGIDLNAFSFRVGNRDVTTDSIVVSAQVYGQQWFVLRPPTQTSPISYDLKVTYNGILSASQSKAVLYGPKGDSDNVILIDRSGSMIDFNKFAAARATARLYVDSWDNGDKIGVASFSGDASVDMQLTPWTDSPGGGSRQTAFNTIQGLNFNGSTSIGDGLRAAYNELVARGVETHSWSIVLLSDGLENSEELLKDVLPDLDPGESANDGKKLPVVHTVAIGPDANRPDLQNLSSKTKGTYHYVSEPAGGSVARVVQAGNVRLGLDAKYRFIATKESGKQQFFSLEGPTGSTSVNNLTIPVENNARVLEISLSWDGAVPNLIELRNPSNVLIAPVHSDTAHRVWRVFLPPGGNWRLFLGNPTIGGVLPPYYVQAAIGSIVTLDTFLPVRPEDRVPGVAMPILAALTEQKPVIGSQVVATIQLPSGVSKTLKLYDDGTHGDGKANDGLYGNTFFQTGLPGSYNVLVVATGNSPVSGPFRREDLTSFHIESKGDCDGDGLPDEWEQQYGTKVCIPDAAEDPDSDGESNREEWGGGTDPNDPDSDNDGESDGTDPDPLDPGVGRITPTWFAVKPGINKVQISVARFKQYPFFEIYRSTSPTGVFQLISNVPLPQGRFIDNTRNDQQVCYRVMARNAAGAVAAWLTTECTTPKADPRPPSGFLVIDGGAGRTTSRHVLLSLFGSDNNDPQLDSELDDVFPPSDSATGVKEMLISNVADFEGATWEPYTRQKRWTVDPTNGLGTVFVRFRDGAGNESRTLVAGIKVQEELGSRTIYLPAGSK